MFALLRFSSLRVVSLRFASFIVSVTRFLNRRTSRAFYSRQMCLLYSIFKADGKCQFFQFEIFSVNSSFFSSTLDTLLYLYVFFNTLLLYFVLFPHHFFSRHLNLISLIKSHDLPTLILPSNRQFYSSFWGHCGSIPYLSDVSSHNSGLNLRLLLD